MCAAPTLKVCLLCLLLFRSLPDLFSSIALSLWTLFFPALFYLTFVLIMRCCATTRCSRGEELAPEDSPPPREGQSRVLKFHRHRRRRRRRFEFEGGFGSVSHCRVVVFFFVLFNSSTKVVEALLPLATVCRCCLLFLRGGTLVLVTSSLEPSSGFFV